MDERYWDDRMETLPAERRRLLRDHRLHWQVRRCWDGSPFYRARLEGAGLESPARGGRVELGRIPLLHMEDLASTSEPGPGGGSLTVAPHEWWVTTDRTADGLPPRVMTDGDTVQRADRAARALWAAGARPGQTLRRASLPSEPRLKGAVLAGASRIGMRLAGEPCTASESAAAVSWDLAGAGPEGASQAASPPSAAGRLRWQVAGGPSGAASDAPAAFGIPFVDLTLAFECAERGGLHWIDDHFLIEILDPHTHEPLASGQVGALVVTELTREGSPLLRYWTGYAAASIEEACGCGRTSARSPRIEPLST